MKLRARAFEKRLWQDVKEHDPRRRLSVWRRLFLTLDQPVVPPLWLIRSVLFLITVVILILCRNSVAAHPSTWIAAMGFVGTFAAVGRANMLGPEYRTLWILPLGAEKIYRSLIGQAVWGGLPMAIAFLLLYGFVALSLNGSGTAWAMVVGCAGLQAMVGIALTLLIKGLPPRSENLQLLVWLPALPAVGLLLFGAREGVYIGTNILYLCHPSGWVNALYMEGCIRANTTVWFALLPIGVILVTLPRSKRAVRLLNADGFFREERTRARRLLRDQGPSPPLDQDWTARGMVERLLARFLTQRERIIVASLLLDRPRWSQSFYGLVVYSMLFLGAGTLIDFTSFYDLLAASVTNYNQRVAKAVVGCIACLVLLPFMLFCGIRLFAWHSASSSGALRLLPLNSWEVVKSIVKINSVLALLLVPLTMLFSFTPFAPMLSIVRWHSSEINIVLKMLAAWWAFNTFVPSLALSPFLAGLRYWRSFLVLTAATITVGALSIGLLYSPNFATDLALILALVVITLAWVTCSGARYCRGL